MNTSIENAETKKNRIYYSLIIALLALAVITIFVGLIILIKQNMNEKKQTTKKETNKQQKNTIDMKTDFELHEQEMLNVETDTSLLNSISTDILTAK